MTKVEKVQALEGAAFSGNWDQFKSFFTEDVYYRVGNTTEVRGPQAIVDWLQKSMSTELAMNDLQIRSAWETQDAVILELNMKGTRIADQKTVNYPCVDIYRFRDGKIADWRVFPIEPTYIA